MALVLRETKGSPLTFEEMDGNLVYLEGISGASAPFAASVDIQPRSFLSPLTPQPPIGVLDKTSTLSQGPIDYHYDGLITLNRGTQWGDITATITTGGAGAFIVPGPSPRVETIPASQCQKEFGFTLNQNVPGTSTLVISISDGTYTITRSATVIIIEVPVISGYGGKGLGVELL